ncbi:MAG TPA: glycosyltransferase family 4 protein [Roseomonas sp.]
MRILILSNLFPPHVLGGYEIACRSVAAALVGRGHVVEVLSTHAPMATPEDPPWLERALALRTFDAVPPESEALHLHESGRSFHPNTAGLLKRLRHFRPDIVYAWNLRGIGGLALLDLVEHLGIPWVLHLMDRLPADLLCGAAPITAGLFARHDHALLTRARVIAMSEHVLTEIADVAGIRFEMPPVIIPGWVAAQGLRQREQYLQGGILRLVTAGSIGTHKGTDLIVDACALLRARGLRRFSVDIYGFGATEPWVTRAMQGGVADCLNFLGPRSQAEILALLPDYDAFLFPTHEREPFGFAPIEAAACGVVPIITRNAGCAERLVDGVHALKIDRSAASLADAIAQLLTGAVSVTALGRRAARLVRTDLDFGQCLDRMERVLREAIRPWDPARLDDPRLPALVYAKHALGQFLLQHP